jgi:hypothetical protein
MGCIIWDFKMTDKIVALNIKDIFLALKRSIIYPIALYLIIIGLFVLMHKLKLEDILKYRNVFIIFISATAISSAYFLIEYIVFGSGKKFVVIDKSIHVYIKGKLKEIKDFSEIQSFTTYGETFALYFLPWGCFNYTVIRFVDDKEIIINCLQTRKKDCFLGLNTEMKRSVFPSIVLYKILK